MELGLILTSRCNAACLHCVTSCGPDRTDALPKQDIIRLLDEAAKLADNKPLIVGLTGGEPFLDFDLLLEVVAHCRSIGAWVSCITNSYWARSDEVVADRLSQLRAAGLGKLGVSVSRFHEQFVPLAKVRRVLKGAAALGLSTELKGAVTRLDLQRGNSLDRWKMQLKADSIQIFPVFPALRSGATLPENEYYREPGLPEQRCPNAMVTIEPDGTAVNCCGPGSASRFLTLGNVHSEPLAAIHNRFMTGRKQTILRDTGPIAFAREAIARGLGDRLRTEYAGPCDLCMHIGSDPDLRRVAEEMSSTPTTGE